MENFSIGDAIVFGWQKMKANFWFLVKALAITFAVTILIQLILNVITPLIIPKRPSLNLYPANQVAFIRQTRLIMDIMVIFITQLVLQIPAILMSIGITKIGLKIHDGEKTELKDLISQYKLFFRYLGGSLLYGLIVIGPIIILKAITLIGLFAYSHKGDTWGLLYLLIPKLIPILTLITIIITVILIIKFLFSPLFIIDKKNGPIESLKRSNLITKGHKIKIFGFTLVLALINFTGMFALGIGLFVTLPTTLIAVAYVYRKLSSNTGATISAQPTPSTIA